MPNQGLFATYDALSFHEGIKSGGTKIDFGPFVVQLPANGDPTSGRVTGSLIADDDPDITFITMPNPYYQEGGPGSPEWLNELVVNGRDNKGITYAITSIASGPNPADLFGNTPVQCLTQVRLLYGLSTKAMAKLVPGFPTS